MVNARKTPNKASDRKMTDKNEILIIWFLYNRI